MRFAEPNLLYLQVIPLLVAALLFAGIWLRRRQLKRLGDAPLVEQQLVRPSPYWRAAKGICLVLGLALAVMALSRPQYGGRIQMMKKRGIDIVVALDFSKSMLAQDVRPNRLARAKLELADFMQQLTGDRVGLVAFAGDTMHYPLTTDYAAATTFWRNLGPYDMPVGGTAIGKALQAGLQLLQNAQRLPTGAVQGPARSQVILLITDGEDHEGAPLEAAKAAQQAGVVVFTVGIGTDTPELIPRHVDGEQAVGYLKDAEGNYVTTSLSPENEDVLRQIAATTGGRYFRSQSDLSGMRDVITAIRNMQQAEIDARQITVYEEVFQWFLIPATLLMLLAFLLPDGRRRAK